jgi:hypothetical protein
VFEKVPALSTGAAAATNPTVGGAAPEATR